MLLLLLYLPQHTAAAAAATVASVADPAAATTTTTEAPPYSSLKRDGGAGALLPQRRRGGARRNSTLRHRPRAAGCTLRPGPVSEPDRGEALSGTRRRLGSIHGIACGGYAGGIKPHALECGAGFWGWNPVGLSLELETRLRYEFGGLSALSRFFEPVL